MPGYRHLFRTREFTPFFLAAATRTAAQTMGGLALGTLVYRSTDSPLLSAISMFGPQLAQMLGAILLMSAADRVPPRAALTATQLTTAATTALPALPGTPTAAILLLVFVQGLAASVDGGARWGLLTEITPKDAYVTARSALNMLAGLTQTAGYATAGALLTVVTPETCLLLSSALSVSSALTTRLGLTARPQRTAGRPSPAATWRTNALLWSSRPRRLTYLGLWLPNGLIVGCESLYVAYDPDAAGTLFAGAALGMLAGDLTVGRLVPAAVRSRLVVPLLLLLAAPYLLFFLHPPAPVAAVTVAVASIGFGASLAQQHRLLTLTPPHLTGHALGLQSAGTMTLQGVSAALAGAGAQAVSPGAAMTGMAMLSLGVTGGLAWAGSRRPVPVGADR
ncbi:MFS transporter [Streptomyces thermocoprophilus]|uniref:MFS transporter n=1 Tax=Streptomyces thermocoprophilus TaxID=78356 RepID=A0ABV5VCX8_9ACTN